MKKFFIFLIPVFAVFVNGCGSGEGSVEKFTDLPYAAGSAAQKLDIYLPGKSDHPFPVLVSIHGGAFMMGDKQDHQLDPMLEGLKRGYAVVSINYRMSGESTFPALVADVKTAIRWLRANAGTYNLDPGKIAVWGGSAGGYLAAMAGTSAGVAGLEDLSAGNPGFSSEVQAVVDWFGPIDFLTMDEQFIKSGKGKADHSEAGSPESRIMGRQITEIPENIRKANPSTYITSDDPPFLIQHGVEDNTVPVQQSEEFFTALNSVLGSEKVSLDLLRGAGHGGPEFSSKENLDRVFAFLDKYLKQH